jgi:hypothetical protein
LPGRREDEGMRTDGELLDIVGDIYDCAVEPDR